MSPPATEDFGVMGREIELRHGKFLKGRKIIMYPHLSCRVVEDFGLAGVGVVVAAVGAHAGVDDDGVERVKLQGS
jgi:hypothetical protein